MQPGDRIAQLVLIKIGTPKVRQVEQLPTTARGEAGFGSTGTDVILAQRLEVEELGEIDINPSLEPDQRQKIEDLLWEYREVLQVPDGPDPY